MQITEQLKKARDDVLTAGRRVWLAGLGSLAVAEERGRRVLDDGGEIFDDLVERGEDFERRGKETVEERVDTARRRAESTYEEAERTVDTQRNRLFARLGIPHRDEIRHLTARVEALTDAVETYRESTAAALDRTVYHVVPNDDGWTVQSEDAERAASRHATKNEALAAAREIAQRRRPSRLVVHRLDGTVQDSYTYEEPTES